MNRTNYIPLGPLLPTAEETRAIEAIHADSMTRIQDEIAEAFTLPAHMLQGDDHVAPSRIGTLLYGTPGVGKASTIKMHDFGSRYNNFFSKIWTL